MRIGAVLATSIELLEKIINTQISAKLIIRNYINENKFIGSKDKKLIYQVLFDTLKKYSNLEGICKKNNLSTKYRNLILLYFFNKNRNKNLSDIYEGIYSLKETTEDKLVFEIAININDEIMPKFPKWIEKKISYEIMHKLNPLYESILREPRFDVAINALNYKRSKIIELFKNEKISTKLTKCSPYGITLDSRIPKYNISKIKKNFFEVQDEGSQIVTLLIKPTKGKKILDLCAGKGTKTIFMNNVFVNNEKIYAYDKDQSRLSKLKRRAEDLNLKNIKILTDIEAYKNSFDFVICDVPCSGTGIWRRRPEDVIKLNKTNLRLLLEKQKKILESARKLCRKDGEIIYITCSLISDENEQQIKRFLKINKTFSLINLEQKWNNTFDKKIYFENKNWLMLAPNIFNTDGYFICILKNK